MRSKFSSILLIVVLPLLIGYVAMDIYSQLFPATIPISTPFMRLNDFVGISGTEYITNVDLINKAQQAIGIKNPALYGNLQSLNDATYLIRSHAQRTNNADLIYIKDGKQKYIYQEIHLPDQDGRRGPAIGYVMIKENGEIITKLYNFDLKVDTLVSKDNTVTNSAKLVMIQSGLANRRDSKLFNWKDIPYSLPIDNSINYVNKNSLQRSKLVFDFVPDISINGIMIFNNPNFDLVPTIGASVLSYKSSELTKYRFLRIGVGARDFNNGPLYSVAPILFNIHKAITFTHNTYIGPTLGYDKRNLNIGIALALSF